MRIKRAPSFRRMVALVACRLHLALVRIEIRDAQFCMGLAEGSGDFARFRHFYEKREALVAEQTQTRAELAALTH